VCPQYSDLELALNSLFQTLLGNQMPALSKTLQADDGALGKLLEKMGVQNGQDVSFQNFWSLINSQATALFDASPKSKGMNCTCSLQ
uniref:S100/CaBP-9k-type calcium binding subdomain domain-containing protein n=1 Tax=Neogobius melanostomus TaxID=47308 RepID=A0A8C6UD44_9GOBI